MRHLDLPQTWFWKTETKRGFGEGDLAWAIREEDHENDLSKETVSRRE